MGVWGGAGLHGGYTMSPLQYINIYRRCLKIIAFEKKRDASFCVDIRKKTSVSSENKHISMSRIPF